MQAIVPLRGAIQSYAWGSHTALAELTGASSPSPEPQAELWLGAHERAPALAWIDGAWTPLDRAIARHGAALLGEAVTARFGVRLPFLLKVLAVERPLSIQVHPGAAQARAGWERDRARDPRERVYADPHPKSELVCALTPFAALCGFRPLDELRSGLGRVGLGDLLGADTRADADLEHFARAWLGGVQPGRDRLAHALREARRAAASDPACAWVARLADEHPGDPGLLAPLLLNLVELAPDEALYVPTGELHCYLAGTAIEGMASSDNVLRAGLTAKAVHRDELLAALRFASQPPRAIEAEPRAPGERHWPAPAEEFELSLLEPAPGAPALPASTGGAEILLCERGQVRVLAAGAPALELARGESCLVSAAAGPYRVEGRGRLFRAALPGADASRSTKRWECAS